MKVLKFGGTSVGTVESILNVKKIVEGIDEPVIVVVSALGGLTDKLLQTSALAANGDIAYEKELSGIIARHLDVIEGVIPDKEVRRSVQIRAMGLLDELGNIFRGVFLSMICLPRLRMPSSAMGKGYPPLSYPMSFVMPNYMIPANS